jgi:programmed cell death protein 5
MDPELAAIRAKRMAEMQTEKQQQQRSQEQMEEMRESMLSQILDNSARERLTRISMVRQEKARAVGDLIINMAKSGQIRGRVNESTLISLLEQLKEEETKVVISRRRADSESEDEYNFS